ncbi:hypothetical protein JW752_03370 [Candidatus Peregrinibacteria bacterium]|nr:hypothetical protein [Candidatus Peregrinibacteria bacterium]
MKKKTIIILLVILTVISLGLWLFGALLLMGGAVEYRWLAATGFYMFFAIIIAGILWFLLGKDIGNFFKKQK